MDMKDAILLEIATELATLGNDLVFFVPVATVTGFVHLVEERPSSLKRYGRLGWSRIKG